MPFPSCVTLSDLLNLSVPWFSQLKMGKMVIDTLRVVVRINVLIYMKQLEACVALSKCYRKAFILLLLLF